MEREGDFGEGTVAVDLVEDGGNVAVTQANKQQYVDLYVEHLLLKSVERQRKAFYRGFHKVGTQLLAPMPCRLGVTLADPSVMISFGMEDCGVPACRTCFAAVPELLLPCPYPSPATGSNMDA